MKSSFAVNPAGAIYVPRAILQGFELGEVPPAWDHVANPEQGVFPPVRTVPPIYTKNPGASRKRPLRPLRKLVPRTQQYLFCSALQLFYIQAFLYERELDTD